VRRAHPSRACVTAGPSRDVTTQARPRSCCRPVFRKNRPRTRPDLVAIARAGSPCAGTRPAGEFQTWTSLGGV